MDIKINSKRIKNLLSYEWVKIVISIIAGIVVWSLLFTTLGTRITVGESFVFVMYENVHSTDSDEDNLTILKNLKDKGDLSYDVLEYSLNRITSAGYYSASYMLSLRVATQEGDVMLISDGRTIEVDENGLDEKGNDPTLEIKSVINNGYVFNVEELLKKANSYCVNNGFIVEGQGGEYTVKEDVIERYFRSVRLKSAKNYKRTYRTEEKIAEGVKNEIKRIENIYKNYLYISQAIETAKANGQDFLWYGEIKKYDYETGKYIEGESESFPFGIDLYKLNQPFIEQKPKVEDTWYTYANGETTAEGLVLCVFNFEKEQPDLQYETLAFIRYVIETYSGY